MVSLTVSAAAKLPAQIARGFPLTVDLKPEATVAEVKAAITAKFPKVRALTYIFVVLSLSERDGRTSTRRFRRRTRCAMTFYILELLSCHTDFLE